MTAEQVFSAYIDTNVILFTIAALWFGLKKLLARTPLRTAYLTQLHLLYALIAMAVVSPLLVVCIEACQQYGILAPRSGLSVSDFLVAQYLEGHIAMAPTRFEELLMLRTEVIHEIVTLSSWLGYVVLGALFGGFAVVVIRNGRDTLHLSKMIRRSYSLRRMGKVDIRFTHETRVPFSTRGLFRYYIVLPTGLLAQNNDVRIAVSHELQHVRQRDLTWEIALELVRPFFFWNPAFAYCKWDVERLRELACDQQVLSRKSHPIREYCECLLRVCQTSLMGDRSNQIITPSVPFVQIDRRIHASHSEGFLKQRILSLLETRTVQGYRAVAAVLMLSLFATVICATMAVRPVTDWSQDRLMLSTIVNLERLNSRTTP